MNDLAPENFTFLQKLLLEKSGLALTDEKVYLLKTRLHPIATSLGFSDVNAFASELRTSKDMTMINSVVDAMTTNETSFFRDKKPFDALTALLPEIMEKNKFKKSIRIWSAACSSGQEIYSIAITMEKFLKAHPGWRYEIVGTDISDRILAQAREGEYGQFEIQRGLTIQEMVEHFTQNGTKWRIKDNLKKNVKLMNLNLLNSMDHMGQFDIVFCRNVLIYFNPETKAMVLNKISKQLNAHGYLFLGACETVVSLNVPFKMKTGYSGIFENAQDVPVGSIKAKTVSENIMA